MLLAWEGGTARGLTPTQGQILVLLSERAAAIRDVWLLNDLEAMAWSVTALHEFRKLGVAQLTRREIDRDREIMALRRPSCEIRTGGVDYPRKRVMGLCRTAFAERRQ